MTTEANAAQIALERGRRDPVWFIENVLGGHLWDVQREIVRSVFSESMVAVKACHASGKTYTAAYLTLAFFYLYPDAKVLTTAPTWTQVEKLLWGELRSAYARMPMRMGGTLLTTELRAGPNWWAMGLSTDEGVRFQGHHGGHILVILDEAPGVQSDIWEAIDGLRAGGQVRLLALGNPVIGSGPFYDAFTSKRGSWHTATISAFDTPNLHGVTLDDLLAMSSDELDDNPRPYLTTRRWVAEMYHKWGTDSPQWQSRVMGQFPTQSEDALLSLTWLEAARARPAADSGGMVTAGLDVAGPGDDETVLCIREGDAILRMESWPQADPRGEVTAALAPYRKRLEVINVDSAGIGYYLARHLEDQGYSVNDVNVGESPADREHYVNLKAELYWGLRLRAEAGDIAGLTDEAAIGQLAGIRYKHNPRGQVVIESKDEARKRGVKSPDRAESIMLAFAERRPSAFSEADVRAAMSAPLDEWDVLPSAARG